MRVPAPTMRIEDTAGYDRCLTRLSEISCAKVGSAAEAECRGINAAVAVWQAGPHIERSHRADWIRTSQK